MVLCGKNGEQGEATKKLRPWIPWVPWLSIKASSYPLASTSSVSRSNTAGKSGFSVSTSRIGSSFIRAIRLGAFLIVNLSAWSLPFTSLHLSGIDTGAPGSGRTHNGDTSSLPCPFCTKSM